MNVEFHAVPRSGSSTRCRRVVAAGIEEVIPFFNVGGKLHAMVLEQMERFMRDVAPAFSKAA